MLRELQTIKDKNIDAMYKASDAMTVGMAVVKNLADKTVSTPETAITAGFFFVRKERVPTGIYTALGDMSDYHEHFINIADGEPVTLIKPLPGERYATDSFITSGLVVSDALMVNTDGQFVKATVPSRFIYGGVYNDAGHTLQIVEVSDDEITNA